MAESVEERIYLKVTARGVGIDPRWHWQIVVDGRPDVIVVMDDVEYWSRRAAVTAGNETLREAGQDGRRAWQDLAGLMLVHLQFRERLTEELGLPGWLAAPLHTQANSPIPDGPFLIHGAGRAQFLTGRLYLAAPHGAGGP